MPIGQPDSSYGKDSESFIWDPATSLVEKLPNEIVLGRGKAGIMATSHWHSQIELNYVWRGYAHYEMAGKSFRIEEGQVAIFWGGLPHRLSDCPPAGQMDSIHLPLMYFFRLRLPDELRKTLMRGAALITDTPLEEDRHAFQRWCDYFRSGDAEKVQVAAEELLLRIERFAFDDYRLIEFGAEKDIAVEAPNQKGFDRLGSMLEFVTDNFRDEIDATLIADSASLHPKYAMSVFKKSTGMTLNQYVQLLRLSYAQSQLLDEETNVLEVAMDSGFGSLSQFNKSFRSLTGMTPSDFKRQMSARLKSSSAVKVGATPQERDKSTF